MANAKVELIAVKKKAIQSFTLDTFPRLPEWFVRQFKLQDWENEVERWRQKSQEAIRDGLLAVKSESE